MKNKNHKTEKKGLLSDKKHIYLILIFACFLAYANSLNNAFVSDDIEGIVNNPLLAKPLNYWALPFGLITSLNYLVFGLNPFSYHLINIILHYSCTVLVFLFLGLFFSQQAGFWGALLFALHPVHTEAVSWVSGGPYLVTTLFILAIYLLYYRASYFEQLSRQQKSISYLSALLLFTYYLIGSHSFFALTPFLLVSCDIIFQKWRKNWKLWIPFLAILILRLLFTGSSLAGRIASVAQDVGTTRSNPVFNLAYSLSTHFMLLIWPDKLTLYHEPAVVSQAVLIVELSATCLLFITLLLLFISKKAKEIVFGLIIFIIFLAPTYSPVTISWLVAERYLYLPSLLLVIMLCFIYDRCLVKSSGLKAKFIVFLAALSAVYLARTVIRNEDWKTPERFWRATVEISQLSPRSHNNMGDVYGREGNIAGAIREFKEAISLRPDYADAYHNLANTYQSQGNIKEAVQNYQKAISIRPQLAESRINLGVIYINSGAVEPAIEQFEAALKIKPGDPSIQQALSFALKMKAENEN